MVIGKKKQVSSSPAIVALQWFTYAIWGLLCLSFSWLIAVSVTHYIDVGSSDNGPGVSYALAAVIVLFIAAMISDSLYAKRESSEKHGATLLVMVIHAVVYALAAVGSLILSVFALTSMLVGEGFQNNETGRTVMLITGLLTALLFLALVIRIVWTTRVPRQQLGYRLFVTVVTVLVMGSAIAGPAAYARMTKPDRIIETTLPGIARDINNYTANNHKLPSRLSDVTYTEDAAKDLISSEKVEYVPNTKPKATSGTPKDMAIAPYPDSTTASNFYQLCVTYIGKKNNGADKIYYTEPSGYMMSEPYVYSHDAGRVCYDLVAYDYEGL